MKFFAHLRKHPSGAYYVTLPGFPIDYNTGWFVATCVNKDLQHRLLYYDGNADSLAGLVRLGYEGGELQRLTTTKQIFQGAELVVRQTEARVPGSLEGVFLPPGSPYAGRGELSCVYADVVFRGSPGLGYNESVDCELVSRNGVNRYNWRVVASNVEKEGYQVGAILEDVENYYFTPILLGLTDEVQGAVFASILVQPLTQPETAWRQAGSTLHAQGTSQKDGVVTPYNTGVKVTVTGHGRSGEDDELAGRIRRFLQLPHNEDVVARLDALEDELRGFRAAQYLSTQLESQLRTGNHRMVYRLLRDWMKSAHPDVKFPQVNIREEPGAFFQAKAVALTGHTLNELHTLYHEQA
jgi:hypothetical protein